MTRCTCCDESTDYACGGPTPCHPTPTGIVGVPASHDADYAYLGDLHDDIQDALLTGNLSSVDAMLAAVDVNVTATCEMIAVLTYSWCWHQSLLSYADLYQRAEAELVRRGIDVGSELSGLAPVAVEMSDAI